MAEVRWERAELVEAVLVHAGAGCLRLLAAVWIDRGQAVWNDEHVGGGAWLVNGVGIDFRSGVRRNVGIVPWASISVRPAVALAFAFGVMVLIRQMGVNPWLSVVPGWVAYGGMLVLLGVFQGEDMAVVRRALPLGRFGLKENSASTSAS